MKEFDGDHDKWPGWWFKLQSVLKANHLGYEGMIERIAQETDATNEQRRVEQRGQEAFEFSVLRPRFDNDRRRKVAQDSTKWGSWVRAQLLFTSCWRSIRQTSSIVAWVC